MSKFPSHRALLLPFSAILLAIFAGQAAAVPIPASPRKTILFFGDSLTAGYGLEEPAVESYPARLGEKLQASYPAWKIVNAGLSGETTSGGLRRIDWVLRQRVDLFFLALGANDGLRGIPADVTQANLAAITAKVRAKNPQAIIILAGMKMPVSMGTYATDFAAIYPALVKADKSITLIPFLLEGVGGVASQNQNDAIHPNLAGHHRVAELVWPTLEPLVKAAGTLP